MVHEIWSIMDPGGMTVQGRQCKGSSRLRNQCTMEEKQVRFKWFRKRALRRGIILQKYITIMHLRQFLLKPKTLYIGR